MPRLLFDGRVVSRRVDGLGRYALGLLEAIALEPNEFEITVLTPRGLPNEHPLHRIAQTRLRAAIADPGMMDPAAHLSMRDVYRRCPSDVYHYPHFNMPVSGPTPAVVTIHDVTPFSFAAYYRDKGWLKRAYFWLSTQISVARAARVIVPSRASADELLRRFRVSSQKVTVVPEGVDQTFLQPVDEAETTATLERLGIAKPYILYVGVSRPHKNLPALLQAYESVAQGLSQDLVLVGQPVGTAEELRTFAGTLDARRRIHWLGYLDERDLRSVYRGADIFALCSLVEGFGLPVIEAMASGVPVVASAITAISEVAGDAAILVDPNSIPSIASGLARAGRDGAVRDELRRRGLARADLFSWKRAAQLTLDVYREAMAQGA